MDTVKTEWIRDLSEATNTAFIGIQEHFKKTKNTETFFKEQFPTFHSHVIPAFREPGVDRGQVWILGRPVLPK